MGEWIKVTAADGNELSAYVARPDGAAAGAVIVLQEIFGVNASIRSVADSYAKEGFLAIAPALFDRIEKGIELTYEGEDMKRAFDLMQKLDPATALQDIAAAYHHVAAEQKSIGILGFCYGGFLGWLTATRGETYKMQPACCVGYYPGGVGKVAAEEPSCPVMLHFGLADSHIGQDQVEAVRSAHPEVEVFTYDGAEHAFANDARPSFAPEASKLASERTRAFFKTHIA